MSSENNTTQITTATTETLPEAPAKIESTWTSFVPMILIFAVFYFLLIRPQEKRRKAQEQLISSVKKGEEVLTAGGIYGKVVKVNESESTVQVEIADNTTVKLSKSSIVDIISRKAAAAPAQAPAPEKEEKAKAETFSKKKVAKK